ncbi:MAG TPA: HAD family phosphatase [Candidatus Korarchaeota archaeon]|nr:HAD family phosphatase [Candidatus Korarchaeota archaeon]
MQTQIVSFDMDGTLLTLPVDWLRVKAEISRLLGKDVVSIRAMLREFWGSDEYWVVNEVIRKREMEAIERSKLYPGVREVLQTLSVKCRIYVVTLQSRAAAEAALELHGLRRFVHDLITREDAPDRLRQVSIVLRRESGPVVLVDDHLDQLAEISRAGLRVEAVWVCRRDYASCWRAAAEFGFRGRIIRDLREILTLLM